jgi:hypothetical protein
MAMLEFISNNALVSTLIAAAVVGFASGGWKWWHDRNDSQTIYSFLLNSKTMTDFAFLSTESISSHTKISEKRVADLCSKHPQIRRNEKKRRSWTLVA